MKPSASIDGTSWHLVALAVLGSEAQPADLVVLGEDVAFLRRHLVELPALGNLVVVHLAVGTHFCWNLLEGLGGVHTFGRLRPRLVLLVGVGKGLAEVGVLLSLLRSLLALAL